MNDMAQSVRARNAHQILKAFGWNATIRNYVVQAEEPCFEPRPSTFLAGQAKLLTARTIEQARPDYIIFEDTARDADWQQLDYGRSGQPHAEGHVGDPLPGPALESECCNGTRLRRRETAAGTAFSNA